MQNTTLAPKTMTPQTAMPIGPDSHLGVDSFKIILEMFSQAITQINSSNAWQPGDAQLVSARNIILEFYDYQDDNLPAVAVEMFNDRLTGNLRNDEQGRLIHSRYQPEALRRYASEVINWGLVSGLVAIPDDTTLH